MIEIRYSAKCEKLNSMADISGSCEDFEKLRQAILEFLQSHNENIYFVYDRNVSFEGWEFVLDSLEINQKGESVKISVVKDNILQVKGSKENLEIFAAWLKFDEENSRGYHAHYEYFEGNQYINSESMPLIIRVK